LNGWTFRLDLHKECERLRQGFKKTVATSDVARVLKEMSLVVKTPDWQKSTNWMVKWHLFCDVWFWVAIIPSFASINYCI